VFGYRLCRMTHSELSKTNQSPSRATVNYFQREQQTICRNGDNRKNNKQLSRKLIRHTGRKHHLSSNKIFIRWSHYTLQQRNLLIDNYVFHTTQFMHAVNTHKNDIHSDTTWVIIHNTDCHPSSSCLDYALRLLYTRCNYPSLYKKIKNTLHNGLLITDQMATHRGL